MRNIKLLIGVLSLFLSVNVSAQILTNGTITNGILNSNILIDGSSTYSVEAGSGANVGKGVIIPSVDLVNFEFDLTFADGSTFPTFFDGMIVYNNAAGKTLTAGVRSSTATTVSPGFYYYSNPGGYNDYNNVSGDAQVATALGKWIPMGSASDNVVKSKTITAIVPANPTAATLNLAPAGVLASGEVVTFLGAKIYDSTGANLIMTADSAYDKVNNVLTTGNGMMYQVLAQGTYKVVLDYK